MSQQPLLLGLLVFILMLLIILRRLRLTRIASYHSRILGKIEVWQKYDGEKVLTTNSFPQGISTEQSSIKKSYWYKIAAVASLHTRPLKLPKALILGLGANTSSSLLAHLNPKVQQTIVEIDPQVIQACRDHFNLDLLPYSQIINADAHKILNSKFFILNSLDVIIVDIFLSSPPYIDRKSDQPAFIKRLLPLLKKDGLVIFNRPSHNQLSRDQGWELKRILQTLFQRVKIFDIKDPRGYRNYVITAKGSL